MDLEPGYPALIILLLTTLLSALFSVSYTPSGHNGGIRWLVVSSPPSTRAQFTGIIATTFWIWALSKVISNGARDLGVFTFGIVAVSCLLVYRKNNGNNSDDAVAFTSRILLGSNVLVAANYALVFFVYDVAFTFQVYLWVGVAYWLIIAAWNWLGYRQWRREQKLVQGQVQSDNNSVENKVAPYSLM